jgi:hypothetical protein
MNLSGFGGRLVSCRSADLPWLVDELDQTTWDRKDLKRDLFRSAKHHRNLNMITRGKPTGIIGLTFAKLVRIGFVFTTEIKITLSDRLTSDTDTDPAECIKALNALQEHRALELETFGAWEDIVRTRFGQEIFKTMKKSLMIDQEVVHKEKISRTKHDVILLLRAIQAEDPKWRDRVQDWLADAKEDYRKGFEKICKEWISIRESNRKTEPDRVGTIDILFQDPLKGRWQFLTRKSRGPYHPEICFAEIKSWLKSHGGWNLRGDECWQIRDEDGPVDRNELRNPRDGERFVVLLQEIPEDVKAKVESTIRKSIAVTRWRRIKSKYQRTTQFTLEEESEPMDPLLFLRFDSVGQAIKKRHARYRTRFKQRKKILSAPLLDSPLIDFTSSSDGEGIELTGASDPDSRLDSLDGESDPKPASGEGPPCGTVIGRRRERRRLENLCGSARGTGRIDDSHPLGSQFSLLHSCDDEENPQGLGESGRSGRCADIGSASIPSSSVWLDAPGLSVKDQSDELPSEGEPRPANTFVARYSSSYQTSLCGSQVGSKSDQSQEGLEPDDLLLSHYDRDRRPHQQIRNQETMDLQCISFVSEISGGIAETERSLGLDSSHSDASVNEELSDCVEDFPD